MPYDRTGVKLPKPKGSRTHPLLAALENDERTYSDIARALEITPQSLAVWMRRCKSDHNYLIPAERVRQFSRLLKITPHTLRPDLYDADTVLK